MDPKLSRDVNVNVVMYITRNCSNYNYSINYNKLRYGKCLFNDFLWDSIRSFNRSIILYNNQNHY